MSWFTRLACVLFTLVLLVGCATQGHEIHMENRNWAPREGPIPAPAPDTAQIVVVRDQPFAAQIILTPLPLAAIALNQRLVAFLPSNSHVVLHVSPGRHTITWLHEVNGTLSKPKQIDVSMRAGERQYLEATTGPLFWTVKPIDVSEGSTLLRKTAPARYLHSGVTVDAYVERRSRSQRSLGDQIAAALPSQESVEAFFEGVATVALFALVAAGAVALVAAGAGDSVGSGGVNMPTYTPDSGPSRSSTARLPLRSVAMADQRFQSTSGRTMADILRDGQTAEIRDTRTGIRYVLENGRISGSDGTRMRVIGSTVYSDSGASYQVIGNTVFSSDGRTCQRAGSLVTC